MNRKIWGVIGITLLAFILGLFIGFSKGLTAFTDIANKIEVQSGEKQVKYDGPKYLRVMISDSCG